MNWQLSDQPGDAAVPVPDRIGRYRPRLRAPEEDLVRAADRNTARALAADLGRGRVLAEARLLALELRYPERASERARLETAVADVSARVHQWRAVMGDQPLPPNLAARRDAAFAALAEFDRAASDPAAHARALEAAREVVAFRRSDQRVELAALTREVLGDGVTLEAVRARNRRAAERAQRASRVPGGGSSSVPPEEWHRAYAERLIGPRLAARLTPEELAVGARCPTGLRARKVLLAYARRAQQTRRATPARRGLAGLGRPTTAASGVRGTLW